MSSQERFVSCLREARELLRDPMVRQLLEVLRLNPGEDALLQTPQTRQLPPLPLYIPELGLEEVSSDSDDTSEPAPAPAFHAPTWDPVFLAECRVLGALLRDGPMHGGCLFRIVNEFRSTSWHIPDRLDVFADWISARPRLFRCIDVNGWIVHAADGAEEFLSCKRDVMGFLAGCYGYKSTASAIQAAIPKLAEEAWTFCTTHMAEEVQATSESVLELRPFFSSREWRYDTHPPLFKACKFHPHCSRKTCRHSHASWRKCYKNGDKLW